MKAKIISFIFLVAFVVTAVHCSRSSSEFSDTPNTPNTPNTPDTPDTPDTSTLFRELVGKYKSDDGQKLTLNASKTYILYDIDGKARIGSYRINESGAIELLLLKESTTFEIQRDSNGQIVRLIETSERKIVFNQVIEQEEDHDSFRGLGREFVIEQSIYKYSGKRHIGTINGKDMVLELEKDFSFYMFRDGKEYHGRYDIDANKFGPFLVLRFSNESETETYNLSWDSTKITSITSNIQEEGLVTDNRYFVYLDFYLYTTEQANQLLENLKGQYQGTLLDREVKFNVSPYLISMALADGTKLAHEYRTFISESDFLSLSPSIMKSYFTNKWGRLFPSLFFEMDNYTIDQVFYPGRNYPNPETKVENVPLGEFDMDPTNRDKKVFHYEIVLAPNSRIEVIGLKLKVPFYLDSYFSKVKK